MQTARYSSLALTHTDKCKYQRRNLRKMQRKMIAIQVINLVESIIENRSMMTQRGKKKLSLKPLNLIQLLRMIIGNSFTTTQESKNRS